MDSKPTQRQVIERLLLSRGDAGFSAYEAIYDHGITRAATYVHDLRRAGWSIRTETKAGETARYILIAPPAGIKPVYEQPSIW